MNIEAGVNSLLTKKIRTLSGATVHCAPCLSRRRMLGGVRFHLVAHTSDGTPLPIEVIELNQLPAVGTAIRPPVSKLVCFVTRAVPASIEATGDIRIAGTIYADLIR